MLTRFGTSFIIIFALILVATASVNAEISGKSSSLPPSSVSKNNIKLFLYTRQKKNIEINETKLEDVLQGKDIKLIAHGWNEDKNAWYYSKLTEALLKKGDYNIIQVDWHFYSRQEYHKAVENTRGVGYYVGNVVTKIHKEKNVPLDKIHFIGHSLGSHVVGFAGKKVKELLGSKIRLISGLDPAGPDFEVPVRDKNSRLSDDDANIVEVVHTNIGMNGFANAIGTIDFYVNGGGPVQPGCSELGRKFDVINSSNLLGSEILALCSHQKSVGYYLDGLEKNGLQATQCESTIKFESGGCKRNKKALLGDESAKNQPKGVFYLNAITKYYTADV